MEPLPRNVWKRLSRLFPVDQDTTSTAAVLFREYESAGFIKRPISELLRLPVSVVADFFHRVSLMHSLESPILRRRDTRWMSEFDYSLVNIRAAGVNGKNGNFLSAAMLLSTLRVRGIILAPVTKSSSDNLYMLESHAVLKESLTDPEALAAGIGPELQMAAFTEAAHLLGLALGFELDYRVDPLAAVVLNRPDLFLWTKNGEASPNDEATQDILRDEVRARVASVRRAGAPTEREVFAGALNLVGLAAKPSIDGSGRTAIALRLAFSDALGEHRPAEHRDEAVKYWGRVFDLWRDRYGFDFLVLRGSTEPEGGHPEIPDRSLVRKAADAARKAGVRRNIGVAAEGNPFDVESYGVQGVDLILEDDGERRADKEWFEKTFALDEKLRRVNLGRKLRFTVPLMVDPGDKDSRPRRERANIKRFVARFLGVGPSRRPLLETMGALEGAWGYKDALSENRSLGWMPDPQSAALAMSIEDIAFGLKDLLEAGERLYKHLDDRVAWWVIRSRHALLIAIVSVENEDLLPPEPFQIDYSDYLNSEEPLTVLEHNFRESRGSLHLSSGTVIETGAFPYRGFRLYVVS